MRASTSQCGNCPCCLQAERAGRPGGCPSALQRPRWPARGQHAGEHQRSCCTLHHQPARLHCFWPSSSGCSALQHQRLERWGAVTHMPYAAGLHLTPSCGRRTGRECAGTWAGRTTHMCSSPRAPPTCSRGVHKPPAMHILGLLQAQPHLAAYRANLSTCTCACHSRQLHRQALQARAGVATDPAARRPNVQDTQETAQPLPQVTVQQAQRSAHTGQLANSMQVSTSRQLVCCCSEPPASQPAARPQAALPCPSWRAGVGAQQMAQGPLGLHLTPPRAAGHGKAQDQHQRGSASVPERHRACCSPQGAPPTAQGRLRHAPLSDQSSSCLRASCFHSAVLLVCLHLQP